MKGTTDRVAVAGGREAASREMSVRDGGSDSPARSTGVNGRMTAGLSGASSRACVALGDEFGGLTVLEQERATRVRGAGVDSSGLPDEALDLLLKLRCSSRADIGRYVRVGSEWGADVQACDRVESHFALACTAYLSSPYSAATIVVCDHEEPKVSVWRGRGRELTRVDWPWVGPAYTDLLSECSRLVGFSSPAGAQRFEALARLEPGSTDDRVAAFLEGDAHSLTVRSGWVAAVGSRIAHETARGGAVACAATAAALQRRLLDLFLALLADVQRHTQDDHLCLAGGLFYNSSFNTAARLAGPFQDVFVPVDPGLTGAAVGATLNSIGRPPQLLSPFLGPSYDQAEIKGTLENCKLQYDWQSDDAVVDAVVSALCKGRLVAWFEGRMEWGPRALGARSIIANPFAPYVLENLNGFLKKRQQWRGYALSSLDGALREHFDGPDTAPFMECDFRPRDPHRFRHVLPASGALVRVHSVDHRSPPRFRQLLTRFGEATGIPCLVNTSFNGFHEPIVCNPRDAVRVFYGTGVDVLALENFVVVK